MNNFDVEVRATTWTNYIINVKARNVKHAMEKVREMDHDKFLEKAEFVDSEDMDMDVTHARVRDE